MKVVIKPDAKSVAEYGADIFRAQLNEKPESVLGLATGSTPVALYEQLIALYRAGAVSFAKARSFNLDEYLGLPADHPQSYRSFMQRTFFDHIDIDLTQTFVPPGDSADPVAACGDYEAAIRLSGGIDVQLLGLGRNGHIGFNEPTSSLSSRTRVKTLTQETIADNARFFADDEFQPHLALTMGIGTISDARKIVLLATGASKASAVKAMVEGPVTAWCPASVLQYHTDTIVIIDEAAGSQLTDPEFFKHIERENQSLLARTANGQ